MSPITQRLTAKTLRRFPQSRLPPEFRSVRTSHASAIWRLRRSRDVAQRWEADARTHLASATASFALATHFTSSVFMFLEGWMCATAASTTRGGGTAMLKRETAPSSIASKRLYHGGAPVLQPLRLSASCYPLLKLGITLKPCRLQTSVVVIADQRPAASKILIPKRQVPPATSLQIKNNDVNASITIPIIAGKFPDFGRLELLTPHYLWPRVHNACAGRSRSRQLSRLTLAAKMHRRLLQHSRNSELFRGSNFAGLQITEGAELLYGDGANRRCGD